MNEPVIDQKGIKKWYNENYMLHREDGPAVEYADGSTSWYQNGKLNREDGPAVEWFDGSKEWWINGKSRRLDGPAIEWTNRTCSYYINGQKLTEDNWNEHPLRKDYIIKENLKYILHD